MSRCATPPTTPSPLPFHCPSPLPTFRNLGPEQLAGVIFTCTEDSLDDCLRAGVFGLPRTHFQYVQHVRASMVLFLFNFSTRELHGIFRAITGGKIDGEPQGVNPEWAANFPAQVDVDTSDTYPPLPETAFRRIITENYISSTSAQFSFELDMDQVARLSEAFKQFAVNRSTPVPNPVPANSFPQLQNANPGSVGGAGIPILDNKPSTAWLAERSRRLSPVQKPSIRDLLNYGRPKSSMEHLTGHTSLLDSDFSFPGSGLNFRPSGGIGGGLPGTRLDLTGNQPLQGNRLSLDINTLQMNNISSLFGGGGNATAVNQPPPNTLLNQADVNTAQALANLRLHQESPWRLDGNDPIPGMMNQLNGSASSQLFNQTRMGLGLNPGAPQGLKGRFSAGNLSPGETADTWTADVAVNAFKLAANQNLSPDMRISQAAANNISPEERQQTKIWQVNSKDMGLVPDTQKLFTGGFSFPEKSTTEVDLTSKQPRIGAYVEGMDGLIGRYPENWGAASHTHSVKPPRPHSSAEGEFAADPFARTLQGVNTMYPSDAKAQLQEVSDESDICGLKSISRASGSKGLKTKSRNNEDGVVLSDGGSATESVGSVPGQVNIGALEEESRYQLEHQDEVNAYQRGDIFVDKVANEKPAIFGLNAGEYYSVMEENTMGKRNVGLGPGLGNFQGPPGEFNEFLSTEPSLILPSAPTTGLNLGLNAIGPDPSTVAQASTANLGPEMFSRLAVENEKLRAENAQLQKQITSSKKKPTMEYFGANNSSADSSLLTDIVLAGGSLEANVIKMLNPDQPEQISKREIPLSFCKGNAVNLGKHLFLMGGINLDSPNKPTNEVYRMDLTSEDNEQWKKLSCLKRGRCLFGAVNTGTKIFVLGGHTECGLTETVEIYDPITDLWIDGPPLSRAKYSFGAAMVNNIIYAVGGQSERGTIQTVEMLDPREGKWIQIGSLSWSRAGLACCPVFNHLFAVGGHNGRSVLSSGEILDLRKGIVNECLTMIEPRQHGVALPIGNNVYLMGGLQTTDITTTDTNPKFSKPEVFNTLLNNSSLLSNYDEEQLSMVYHSACSIIRTLY